MYHLFNSWSFMLNILIVRVKLCRVCHTQLTQEEFSSSELKRAKHGNKARCRNCVRRANWLRKYHLTEEDYNKMFNAQKGCCDICGDPLSRTPSHNHIDHDHNHHRKHVRGILCSYCNPGLGFFDDDPVKLMRAAWFVSYTLKSHHISLMRTEIVYVGTS